MQSMFRLVLFSTYLDIRILQMYTPLIILIIPLIYIAYSIISKNYNQAANNLCFIMISFHGLASTIVMVLIHKSYREACIDIFCFRMHYKTTPIVESRRNSFVSYVPRSKIRDDVVVVAHQITYWITLITLTISCTTVFIRAQFITCTNNIVTLTSAKHSHVIKIVLFFLSVSWHWNTLIPLIIWRIRWAVTVVSGCTSNIFNELSHWKTFYLKKKLLHTGN